ncbi:tRNA-guanine transglycosylase DpdA [Shewanella sp. Isolate11]|uniref:tRNA-guanine transglycosylase DpdA n=1 Tax=Shewanella sp. Isolate11 TaxID=2908530 RepID=UPI001EFCC3B5|nr:tRNA-guanine transglycosylase [Shewanella sp. Isolate11]
MNKVKFYFPDSHDYVDPTFDFENETNNEHRVIQRDDKYAHEIFSRPVYDGILVSKAVVDGISGVKGKYSVAQRQRFFREGIYRFFRLPKSYSTIGDCGAFSYANEEVPPYSIHDVVEFYVNAGFTNGISLDHIIFDFAKSITESQKKFSPEQLTEFKRRKEITLDLAHEFYNESQSQSYEAYGVAHGWNPESYADSVSDLQSMGYKRIALGGMIPLKTQDILSILEKTAEIKKADTQFHLLGINRLNHIQEFSSLGVSSFDSTAPLMQGLKDDKFNYHTHADDYTSISVPQVEANNSMRKLVSSGTVDHDEAKRLEKACLKALISFAKGEVEQKSVLDTLCEYEKLYNTKKSRREAMEKALTDQPWKNCNCDICKDIGIHVILKRGAARNRRRGFHNLYIAYQKLQHQLSLMK